MASKTTEELRQEAQNRLDHLSNLLGTISDTICAYRESKQGWGVGDKVENLKTGSIYEVQKFIYVYSDVSTVEQGGVFYGRQWKPGKGIVGKTDQPLRPEFYKKYISKKKGRK